MAQRGLHLVVSMGNSRVEGYGRSEIGVMTGDLGTLVVALEAAHPKWEARVGPAEEAGPVDMT